MKEQLISLKTAKLAKDKGFDILCINNFYKNNTNDGYDSDRIERPTQGLLQKWLREKYNIHLSISVGINGFYCYLSIKPIGKLPTKQQRDKSRWINTQHYPEKYYERALEKGLYQGLKLIK